MSAEEFSGLKVKVLISQRRGKCKGASEAARVLLCVGFVG